MHLCFYPTSHTPASFPSSFLLYIVSFWCIACRMRSWYPGCVQDCSINSCLGVLLLTLFFCYYYEFMGFRYSGGFNQLHFRGSNSFIFGQWKLLVGSCTFWPITLWKCPCFLARTRYPRIGSYISCSTPGWKLPYGNWMCSLLLSFHYSQSFSM